MTGKVEKKHWMKLSPLDVQGKDPKYGYKWLLRGTLDNRKREGWEPCLDSVDGKDGLKTGSGVENDLYICANGGEALVLCKMPKSMVVERGEYYENQNKIRESAAKDNFKTEAEKAGLQLEDKDYE